MRIKVASMRKLGFLLFLFLIVGISSVVSQDVKPVYRVIGYYPSYAIYGSQFFVTDIAADKLTHINYAFAQISETGEIKLGDEQADTQYPYANGAAGNLGALAHLKIQYPALQTLISVGGYTWSDRFSDVALTAESRDHFAQSCVEFIRKYGLDGVDIDWEFPVNAGMSQRRDDATNFTLLLLSLRTALDAQAAQDGRPYWLTVALGGTRDIYGGLDLTALHPLVDWINIMTYSLNADYPHLTAFSAPLYDADNKASIDLAVRDFLAAGVPGDKIVIGVPFYAIGWQGAAAINHGLHQAYGGLADGSLGPGFYTYGSIAADYVPYYARFWDETAQVPWLYDTQSGLTISYEDTTSIAQKAAYVQAQKLGGAMVWELSGDDAQATLLSALSDGLKSSPSPAN
ncbi:MAG: glycoside hydrolase family 18 protein [Chloroflexota bacterium]